ncbi:hypothetical protein PHYBLDRAFT_72814 [Phycomyces blakesleeanus NRRL 1555(-)]|uniref:Uncharacterized protein n=1 Tax=Phycomyces blakesleeanus (strain ATCC 8743b / DSM 1359 / FGSC 10004 / NBRC 33097 / NRRL 1555) TaxID=763407 RepID=A0A167M4E1_PHYB8|nr:hypothetical protein PHYBLDRAFT_72814 [Phycomyces blakesleeanus NRRL 1555(-)]OAD71759.1 hypothetical protein PHYBLDRAFT_72814 [Phycomyces blakesleeanus NRRL 1555(-)]|eukprot:XP_018289799.1 hypothetical protein PHYBLDRAFT_72814 [Phycomyces blakesleeanus NRRL 1555(-)]
MKNILLCKAGVQYCLGGWAAQIRLIDRRTSNFKIVSNNVAGPQLWSNPIRKTLAVIAIECNMNCHNLVSSLACLWDQNSTVIEHKTIELVCTTKIWKDNVVYRVRTSFDSRHIRANDLVVLEHLKEYGYVIKFFSHSVLGETRLFTIVDCLQGSNIQFSPKMTFRIKNQKYVFELNLKKQKQLKVCYIWYGDRSLNIVHLPSLEYFYSILTLEKYFEDESLIINLGNHFNC